MAVNSIVTDMADVTSNLFKSHSTTVHLVNEFSHARERGTSSGSLNALTKHLASEVTSGRMALELSEQSERQCIDELTSDARNRYSSMDVAGAFIMMPCGELIVSIERTLTSLEGVIESATKEGLDTSEILDLARQLTELLAVASRRWNRIARQWPWREESKIAESRRYFEAGNEGVDVREIIDGLRR